MLIYIFLQFSVCFTCRSPARAPSAVLAAPAVRISLFFKKLCGYQRGSGVLRHACGFQRVAAARIMDGGA
jgi:hypothetical protein